MKKTLMSWDDVPEFQAEAKELANALKLETVLRSAMREAHGDRL